MTSRAVNPAAKYAARLLYSQVDLGSDDEDARSSISRHSVQRQSLQVREQRQSSQQRIVYEQGDQNQKNTFSQGKLNQTRQNQAKEAQKNGVDVNMQRRMDSKSKWFTSQIADLPGPRSEVKHNLHDQYKRDS
jgi:hypothetical protein